MYVAPSTYHVFSSCNHHHCHPHHHQQQASAVVAARQLVVVLKIVDNLWYLVPFVFFPIEAAAHSNSNVSNRCPSPPPPPPEAETTTTTTTSDKLLLVLVPVLDLGMSLYILLATWYMRQNANLQYVSLLFPGRPLVPGKVGHSTLSSFANSARLSTRRAEQD